MSVLEVLQFSRDASVAESWLAGQEPLVRAAELGSNVDEVESLIKRHEAFEKLAAGWEERFVQLEKLTTVNTHSLTPSLFISVLIYSLSMLYRTARGTGDSEKEGRRGEGAKTSDASPRRGSGTVRG